MEDEYEKVEEEKGEEENEVRGGKDERNEQDTKIKEHEAKEVGVDRDGDQMKKEKRRRRGGGGREEVKRRRRRRRGGREVVKRRMRMRRKRRKGLQK